MGGEHCLQAGGLVDILLAYPEQLRGRIVHNAVVLRAGTGQGAGAHHTARSAQGTSFGARLQAVCM